MESNYQQSVTPKRCLDKNINWSKQWNLLWNFKFFSVSDRQFIHKLWNVKLWTYDNRTSNSELICSLYLMPKDFLIIQWKQFVSLTAKFLNFSKNCGTVGLKLQF